MAEKHITTEAIEAYLAGLLAPADAEQIDAHLHDCTKCAEAVETLQFGGRIETLFSDLRPSPAVEERAVASFRKSSSTLTAPCALPRKTLVVLGAIVALGAFGAIAMNGEIGTDSRRAYTSVGSKIADAPPSPPAGIGNIGKTGDFANNGGMMGGGMTGMGGGMMGMGGGMMGMGGQSAEQKQSINGALPQTDTAITKDNLGQPNAPAADPAAVKTPPSSLGGTALSSRGSAPSITAPGASGTSTSSGSSSSLQGPYFGNPYYQGILQNQVPGNTPPGGFGQQLFGTTTPGQPSTFTPGAFKNVPPPRPKPADSGAEPTATPTQPPKTTAPPPAPTENPEPVRRIVIRSGDIEFEIDSFDSATATVTKLVAAIKGAFVSTVNSEKLPSGKVKGSITVRVPPESLDGLVLDLRKELGKSGELKGVRLASQDVTKQYTDLESRLRGARTMEQRLLQIIKEGKGEIKQLLEAEKELGIWRTKIEEFEGELRYYSNLAALSTLTIALTEKEAKTIPTVTESERVQAGVEVEDVDKAYQQLWAAVTEVKGRITRSEVKQYAAGQFNATVNFEVSPDAAGPLRDRLRQLGHLARLEIDRSTTGRTPGDPVPLPAAAKTTRGDTAFYVQLYNLANVAPRETVTLALAATDVAVAYQSLRDAFAKTQGRIVSAQLNEQDRQNVTAQIDFEVRRTQDADVRTAIAKTGEVVSRQSARATESDSVTDTKVLYRISLIGAARVKPRETKVLQLAAPDVSQAYRILRAAVGRLATPGRVLAATLNEQDRQNVTAQFDFEVTRADAEAVDSALEAAGEVIARQALRAPESEFATDSKVLYQLSFSATSRFKPRETTTLTVEVADVERTAADYAAWVGEAKGRQLAGQSNRESSGKTTAKLTYEVPLAATAGIVERFKAAGIGHVAQTTQDPQAPAGKFAVARLDVTLSNVEGIVPADEGLWTPVRRGLSYSVSALLKSVTYVVFGLCAILPWAIIGYVAYRLVRRLVSPSPAPVLAASAAAPPSDSP